MPNQIPTDVVADRYERLVKTQERISLRRNRATIGTRHEVLIEGPSKKDPARATARTRTNKIVHLPAAGRHEGEFLHATIIGAHPHHLDGIPA
jgi:tRNA-2-methylthio-N6-dimethylallyladenosine synthase